MRIGLLGGTFDPFHRGHLDVGHAARRALDLDQIWIVPARTPPHRSRPHASAAHRFAMAALAIETEAGFLLADLDMDSEGPSFTVSTLDRLDTSRTPGRTFFFITGADAFRDVPSWKAYPDLLDRCHFVVVSRPGWPARDVRTALPPLASRMFDTPCTVPPAPSIFLVDAATAAVSSTDVRQAVAARDALDSLIPPRVAAYIDRQGLYRAAGPVESPKGHA